MTSTYTFEATKTRTIRALKAIYLAGLFALAVGLFCGELPESIRLLDDTTNDYVADSSASAARENESARQAEFNRERAVSKVGIAARAWPAERAVRAPGSIEPAPI